MINKDDRTLLVRCFDPRLNRIWSLFIKSLRIRPDGDDNELLSLANGAGDLPQVLRHLRLAYDKHGVRKVILTVHEDCLGGAVENDLFRARAAIREADYIGLKVRAFYFYRYGKKWALREVTN